MVLLHSVSTSQTSNHASAAGVHTSQPNSTSSNHRPTLHTSIRIAGVLLFFVLSALIILSAQASGKDANDEFNAANKDSAAALNSSSSTEMNISAGADGSAESSSSNSTASVQSNASSDGTSVNLSVNGQDVDLPDSDNYQKVVTSPSGTTTLTVSSSTNGESNSRSRTTTKVDVKSKTVNNGDNSSSVNVHGTGAAD